MYDRHLNAEQIEFRDTVRAFAEQETRPASIHPDRLQEYAPWLLAAQLAQASAMGLRRMALSEVFDNCRVGCRPAGAQLLRPDTGGGVAALRAESGRGARAGAGAIQGAGRAPAVSSSMKV